MPWKPLNERNYKEIKQGRIALWRNTSGNVPITGTISMSRVTLLEFMEACKRGEIATRKNEKTGEIEYLWHLNVFKTDEYEDCANKNLPIFTGYVSPKILKKD